MVKRDPHRKSSVVEQLYQSVRSSERNATKLLTKYKSNECTPERPSLLKSEKPEPQSSRVVSDQSNRMLEKKIRLDYNEAQHKASGDVEAILSEMGYLH